MPTLLIVEDDRNIRHRLVIDIAPGLPPVLADTQWIAEVLVNLAGNAAKQTSRATPITILAVACEANMQVSVER